MHIVQINEKSTTGASSAQRFPKMEVISNSSLQSDKKPKKVISDLELKMLEARSKWLELKTISLSLALGIDDSSYIQLLRKEHGV